MAVTLKKIDFKSGDLMTEDRLRLLDENYNNLVDAVNALNITASTDGREVELINDGTYIKWRYKGTSPTTASGWNILLDLSTIKGEAGKSAYDIYVESLPASAKPLSEKVWLQSLQGKDGITQNLKDYYTSAEIDKKLLPLERRSQTYVSLTQPLNMQNGDFWIKSNP